MIRLIFKICIYLIGFGYYLEVADRNCGATSNGINDYGNYYAWNSARNRKEVGINEAEKAAKDYKGMGYSDWRLPNDTENEVILNKIRLEYTFAILKNEVGDNTKVVYFPYGGIITSKKNEVKEKLDHGYFWSNVDINKKYAVVLEFTSSYFNNRQIKKCYKCNVRCVRTLNK